MSLKDNILTEIRLTAHIIGSTKYERDELTQTVSLIYLENPALFQDADSISAYIWVVVRNSARKLKTQAFVDIDFDNLVDEPEEVLDIDRVKTLQEMMSQLDNLEQMWIIQYIECGFNYSELERRSKITRQCSKKRIKQILDKWKHLDIYLQR